MTSQFAGSERQSVARNDGAHTIARHKRNPYAARSGDGDWGVSVAGTPDAATGVRGSRQAWKRRTRNRVGEVPRAAPPPCRFATRWASRQPAAAIPRLGSGEALAGHTRRSRARKQRNPKVLAAGGSTTLLLVNSIGRRAVSPCTLSRDSAPGARSSAEFCYSGPRSHRCAGIWARSFRTCSGRGDHR